MQWVVFIGLCQLFSNHLSDRSDLHSPSKKQVTDLYSQKQHCKLNKLNISLIALFSHSVSLDWITFVDPAVCTGEFCHLPKVPCCSCQCLSLAPCSLSLPATNGWFWPLCAPFMCSSSHNWFCVVVGFWFFWFFFFIRVWFVFVFLKDTPCNIQSSLGLGSILSAGLTYKPWSRLSLLSEFCNTLLWILLQRVPLQMLLCVKGNWFFFLH